MTFSGTCRSVLTGIVWCASGALASPSMADNVTPSKNHPLWCITAQPEYSGSHDWVKLSEHSVHVVRATMQGQAKAALAQKSIIEMTLGDARLYLRDGENLSDGKHIYLVRAAAFYVDDKYDLPRPAFRNLPFDVSYSQSRHMLSVSNFALGYAGIVPTNLALVVESVDRVGRSEAICSRTQ